MDIIIVALAAAALRGAHRIHSAMCIVSRNDLMAAIAPEVGPPATPPVPGRPPVREGRRAASGRQKGAIA